MQVVTYPIAQHAHNRACSPGWEKDPQPHRICQPCISVRCALRSICQARWFFSFLFPTFAVIQSVRVQCVYGLTVRRPLSCEGPRMNMTSCTFFTQLSVCQNRKCCCGASTQVETCLTLQPSLLRCGIRRSCVSCAATKTTSRLTKSSGVLCRVLLIEEPTCTGGP